MSDMSEATHHLLAPEKTFDPQRDPNQPDVTTPRSRPAMSGRTRRRAVLRRSVKIRKIIFNIAGLLIFLVVFSLFLQTFLVVKASGEAEVVAPIVRSMADEIEAFIAEKDRRPQSLAEIETFSGLNLSEIKNYSYRFYSEGPLLFHMTVNDRYGFSIDQSYQTKWTGAESTTEPVDAQNGERPAREDRSP